MITRLLVTSAVLMGALTFLSAADAQAGPRIRVGVGVTIPIGHRPYHHPVRRVHTREVVEYVGGYYETRTREVHVHGAHLGYDRHGHVIHGPDRVEIREYQVWVPRRRIVRRVRGRYRGHRGHHRGGYATVGGSVRVR